MRHDLDPKYYNIVSIHTLYLHTVPAQIERHRSNFHLGFFGEDFTK